MTAGGLFLGLLLLSLLLRLLRLLSLGILLTRALSGQWGLELRISLRLSCSEKTAHSWAAYVRVTLHQQTPPSPLHAPLRRACG